MTLRNIALELSDASLNTELSAGDDDVISRKPNTLLSLASPTPTPLSKIIEFTESLTAIWYRWWARSAFLSHRLFQNEITPQPQFVFNGACVVAVQPRLTHPVIHPLPSLLITPKRRDHRLIALIKQSPSLSSAPPRVMWDTSSPLSCLLSQIYILFYVYGGSGRGVEGIWLTEMNWCIKQLERV